MKSRMRKTLALLLVLTFAIGSVSASAVSTITTKFDYVLQQIESNSLYTQDKGMSQSEIDQWNSYLTEHPDQFSKVINDYLATLDTHSMYLTKEEYEQGFSQLTGYVGVGLGMEQKPEGVFVSSVNRSGPAYVAGVQVGDRIVKIDGKDVTCLTSTDLSTLLRGELGTKLTLTIERNGTQMDFVLTRQQIQEEYVSSETVSDGVKYIRIEAMGSKNDLETFKQIWDGLDEKNTRAVILDLRSNGGGLVDDAWGMADAMIEQAGVYMGAIQWREDQGGLEKHYSTGGGLPLNEICVLVDGNTASAAELLTGILKEAAGAEVIGTTTYGKGQGQYHISMMDGSRLVITCMEMNLPQAGCWEGKGIEPTIKVTGSTSVQGYLQQLPALDTTATIRYGEQSEQVRALSGRLFLLGYTEGASDVFDTELLSGLRKFQKDNGLTGRMVADPATLQAVAQKTTELGNGANQLDNAYYKALDLCKQAAAQPQRYTSLADGSWRAA